MNFLEIIFYTLTNYVDFFLWFGILMFWVVVGPKICWVLIANTYDKYREKQMVKGLKAYFELKDKGHKPNLKEFLR